jgi:predicted hydrocarbon binding protein
VGSKTANSSGKPVSKHRLALSHVNVDLTSTLSAYAIDRLRELAQKREIPLADTDEIPRDAIALRTLVALGFARVAGAAHVLTELGREAAAALPPATVVRASGVWRKSKRGRRAKKVAA